MTLPVGTKVGRYEIRSKIGEGGMGEVYRARDEKLNRGVAIKVLPASLSQDQDRLRRFEQEAQAAGAGEPRTLERGPIEQYNYGVCWFPDGKRVVFQGREPGHDWRCYIQSVEGGPPRPIKPEGTTRSSTGIFISPDSRLLIASNAQHKDSFYPIEGGTPQPIRHLESGDKIIGWSSDGRSLNLARTQEMPIRVYRFDPATGRRELLKEILPADPAGTSSRNSIFMTPDGKGHEYSVRRVLSNLYLVEGLK